MKKSYDFTEKFFSLVSDRDWNCKIKNNDEFYKFLHNNKKLFKKEGTE